LPEFLDDSGHGGPAARLCMDSPRSRCLQSFEIVPSCYSRIVSSRPGPVDTMLTGTSR
jgi:hypothetical protein